MSSKKPEEEGDNSNMPDAQRRLRRISVLLILAVVAIAAVGLWFFSSWFAGHYYGGQKPLNERPAPSSSGRNAPPPDRGSGEKG